MREVIVTEEFKTVQEKILSFFEDKGIHVFDCIDQQQAGQKVGLEIPPTTLIIFGKPEAGTILMQQNDWITFELPSKILLIGDGDKTKLIYRLPYEYEGAQELDASGKAVLDQLNQIYNALIQLFA